MNKNDRPFQETEYPVEVTVVGFPEPASYFYFPRNEICSEFFITNCKATMYRLTISYDVQVTVHRDKCL